MANIEQIEDIQNYRFYCNSLEHFPNPYICLLQAGWERCNPKYQYTNYRDFYLVHFVRSGEGTLQLAGHTYKLAANDVFLIRPNQLAVYTADADNPWEYYFFAFSGEMSEVLLNRSFFQNTSISHMADDSLAFLIRKAALELSTCECPPDVCGLEYLFKFMKLLIPLSQDIDTQITDDSTSSEQIFYSVQQHLQFNYFKPINIQEICNSINISRSYLFRIFKKHSGGSVEDYLLSLRLQHAKKLLASTTLSTTQIANLVGYTNFSSFYRMFKNAMGIAPNDWREKHKKLVSKDDYGSVQEHSED